MTRITIEVSEEWYNVLGVISRHQDGFVWIEVEELSA